MHQYTEYCATTHPVEDHDGFNRFLHLQLDEAFNFGEFRETPVRLYQIDCHLGKNTTRLNQAMGDWYHQLTITPTFKDDALYRTLPIYVVTPPDNLEAVKVKLTRWLSTGEGRLSFFDRVVKREIPNPGVAWVRITSGAPVYLTDNAPMARRFYLECYRKRVEIDYDAIRIGDTVVTHYRPLPMTVTTLGPDDRIGAKLPYGRVRVYHPHDVWPLETFKATVPHFEHYLQAL